jgi:hypothetical protein
MPMSRSTILVAVEQAAGAVGIGVGPKIARSEPAGSGIRGRMSHPAGGIQMPFR